MQAKGRDIIELFGFSPDDTSPQAITAWKQKACPFVNCPCTKTNHDQTSVYGTCSVSCGASHADGSEIIICPKRLYADQYEIFSHVLKDAWPNSNKALIIGGSPKELRAKALKAQHPVIAFGQGSGKEIQINANGNLSMDWVLQSYTRKGDSLIPEDFIGMEIQSIDITGNYRATWDAYRKIKEGKTVTEIPNSGHGLNWANVHKRLIPQIIRKGNIYRRMDRCAGFYFLLPDAVYKKFEEVIGDIKKANGPSKTNLSVLTFKLGAPVSAGKQRELVLMRHVHYPLAEIAAAFIGNSTTNAPDKLDETLRSLLD